MDYINTSHPNFVGGSKAVEIALQQVKSSRVALPISRQKVYLPIVITSIHVLRVVLIGFVPPPPPLFCLFLFPFVFPFHQFSINQDAVEPDKAPMSERSLKSRGILARQVNGIITDQVWKIFHLDKQVQSLPQYFTYSELLL